MDPSSNNRQGPYFNNSQNYSNANSSPMTNYVSDPQAPVDSDRHLNYDPRFYSDAQSPDYQNVRVEDLLPPLKQLDVNQLPPDVLAHLLKSKRLDQLVAPNVQRQFCPENQTSPPPPNSGLSASGISQNQGAGRSGPPLHQNKSRERGSGGSYNNNYGGYDDLMYQQQTNVMSNTNEFEVDNADCVLSTITDTITQLTVNPGDFSRSSKKTVEVLKKYLSDVDTLGIVVTLIFEQSVSNPNFCYSGARLCQVLERNGIAVGNETFKNLLIRRCQEEFMNCLKSTNDPAGERRTQGLTMFFAELYLNFTIEKQGRTSKNALFGSAAAELMQCLANRPPTLENVKCIHQTLKLIGWDLDHDADRKIVSEIQKLYQQLSKVLMQFKTKLEPRVQFLLESIFDLRKKDWNKGDYSETSSTTSPNQSEEPVSYDEVQGQSQFYELPDTVEDEDFNLLIDDEPDEVRQAYEEFLQSSR